MLALAKSTALPFYADIHLAAYVIRLSFLCQIYKQRLIDVKVKISNLFHCSKLQEIRKCIQPYSCDTVFTQV